MIHIKKISEYSRKVIVSSRFVIGILGVVIIVTGVLICGQTHQLIASGDFSHPHSLRHNRHVALAEALAPRDIKPWMTFDYLNKIFLLPQNYLQQALNIQNASYPKITIGHYAKMSGQNSTALIASISQALNRHTTVQ